MHKQDPGTTFSLLHKEEEEGKISLNCMACGYKKYPGINFYNKVLREIESAKNESEKSGGSL